MRFLAFCLLLVTTNAFAWDIDCTGIEDGAAIQASLDAGNKTVLKGVCRTDYTITITQPDGQLNQLGDTLLEGGVLRSTADNAILIKDVRRAGITRTEIYSDGIGILVQNATQVSFTDMYLTSKGDGVVLQDEAAVWFNGRTHLSGQPQAIPTASVGIRIGNSVLGFEAVYADDMLIEGYYAGIRIGGAGNNLNMMFRGLKIDRPSDFGILINPVDTASVRNIIISDFWINGAPYPIAIVGSETTGTVKRIEIHDGHVLGTSQPNVTVWGSSNVDYRESGVIRGELEPG